MDDTNLDKLRDLLHLLISSNADYNTILRVSQKLDKIILKFMYENSRENSTEKLDSYNRIIAIYKNVKLQLISQYIYYVLDFYIRIKFCIIYIQCDNWIFRSFVFKYRITIFTKY